MKLAIAGALGIAATGLLLAACSAGGSDAADAGDTGTGSETDVDAGADSGADTDADTDADADADTDADTDGDTDTGTGFGLWVTGYYAGYEHDLYPVSEIDFAGLTHLAVARVVPVDDGTLVTTFDIDDVQGPALAQELAAAAHGAGRKAILMVGGAGNDSYAGFVGAASDAHRAAFVANLLSAMDGWGFDGLDLDWEPVQAADQAPLLALAEDLRAARPGIILTVPVGWVNANFPTVDPFYADLAAVVDQMNIMSYGMADAWSDWHSWHSSALEGQGASTPSSIASSVDAYAAAGVPLARLGLGMGFYGSCWSAPVTAPGQDPQGSSVIASDGAMSFANIMAEYWTAGAAQWDAAASVPFLGSPTPLGPEGCTFVSYEDESSIIIKGDWARQRGIGGAIIWTINQGYRADEPVGERNPLLAATADGFLD